LRAIKGASQAELEHGAGLSREAVNSLKTIAKQGNDMYRVSARTQMRLDDMKALRDHNFVTNLNGAARTKAKGVQFTKTEIKKVLTRVKRSTVQQLQHQGLSYNTARQLIRSRDDQSRRDFGEIHKMAGHVDNTHANTLTQTDLTRLRDTFGRDSVVEEDGTTSRRRSRRRHSRRRNGENINEVLENGRRDLKQLTLRRGKLKNDGLDGGGKDVQKSLRKKLRRLTRQQHEFTKAHKTLQESMNQAMNKTKSTRRTSSMYKQVASPIQAMTLANSLSHSMMSKPNLAARAVTGNLSRDAFRFLGSSRNQPFNMFGGIGG
jgi:hypothetical protein